MRLKYQLLPGGVLGRAGQAGPVCADVPRSVPPRRCPAPRTSPSREHALRGGSGGSGGASGSAPLRWLQPLQIRHLAPRRLCGVAPPRLYVEFLRYRYPFRGGWAAVERTTRL